MTASQKQMAVDACCRVCASAAGLRSPNDIVAPDGDVTPGDLLAAASRFRLLPAVSGLVRDGGVEVPPWFREVARASIAHADMRTAALVEEACHLSDAFDAAGVCVAFRKGAHLANLYPTTGYREFTDIDLLFDAGDRTAVLELLRGHGYDDAQPASRLASAFLAVATHNLPIQKRRTELGSILVDAGSSIMIPALVRRWSRGADLGDVADVRERCETGAGGLWVLKPPHALLDIVVNLYIGSTTMMYVNELRFQRLAPFMDLLRVMRDMSAADMDVCHELTDRLGAWPAVEFAAVVGGRLFGAEVVEQLVPETRSAPDPSVAERYGELELGQAQTWDVGLIDRLFLDRLPSSVPAWTSPIAR